MKLSEQQIWCLDSALRDNKGFVWSLYNNKRTLKSLLELGLLRHVGHAVVSYDRYGRSCDHVVVYQITPGGIEELARQHAR